MADLLQTVADLTKTVHARQPRGVGVAAGQGRSRPRSSPPAQLATDLDETQYERGHGPCLHAARTGELTEIPDTRTDDRWPDYTPRARPSTATSAPCRSRWPSTRTRRSPAR